MRIRPLLLLAALAALPAQARTLHWQQLDVEARLDRDARLHTSETQTIVFDGDWNGGERRFSVRPRQSLSLDGVTRIEDGREIRLQPGDLSQVDQYKMFDGNVLRWRSRLPQDPPFSNTAITYRIDYTLAGVVRKEGDVYRLNHDFVFPDRSGDIDHFILHLAFDPAWGGQRLEQSRDHLLPGQSFIVTRTLEWHGAGSPAAVVVPVSRTVSAAIAIALLIGVGFVVAGMLAHDRGAGRLAPLMPPGSINDVWLERFLFHLPPEVAGACWDDDVGAPEVAAVLARMAVEKKIASEVQGPEGVFGKPVLHLRLLVDRNSLQGYERALANKLFFNSRKETDTESVKQHYASTGLDLVAVIKPDVQKKLDELPKWREKAYKPPVGFDLLFVVLAAAALIAPAVAGNESDALYAASSIIVGLVCLTAGAVAATINRRKITAVVPRYILVGVLVAPLVAVALSYIWAAGAFLAHVASTIGLAVWTVAVLKVVADAMRIPDAPETIAFRKTIAAARQFFITQLQSSSPRLRDEWLPWILGFGLGSNVDSWFRSLGGSAATATATSRSSSSFDSSSSSIASSSSGWTGGGGTFGGAGATGAWTVAAGALAAGVSAPSSSSSSSGGGGGGGGGGSSSGGGGGGGW